MEIDTKKVKAEENESFVDQSHEFSDGRFHPINVGPKSPGSEKLPVKTRIKEVGSDLDNELIKVRGNSCYIIVVSSIMISFACAEMIIFGVPFLELIPPLECTNGDGQWYSCEKEEACRPEIEYQQILDDRYSLNNWVDDLDLVCSEEWKVGLLGSAVFAGMFVGALTLSPISDMYGRKPVHLTGILLSLIGGMVLYFYPTWTTVLISLLLKGIGVYSRLSISYLYTLEMFDEERCKFVAMVIMSINNSLSCLMAAYFLLGGRDATVFLIAGNCILLYSLCFIPILPESPKLLYSLKDYEKTKDCLKQIGKLNGVEYQPVKFEDEIRPAKDGNQVDESTKSFLTLIKIPQFLINILIVVFVFMFNVFSMYMLSFMLKYLPGDKYVNLFLLGVADFIPSLMSGAVMALFPTKRAMIIMHVMICAFTTAHMFFGDIEYLGMPIIFFVRFFITLESCLNFYIVYELFPARFASAVYGACNIMAGLVSILSPMAVEVFANPLLIVLVLGSVCVVGC